jgi:transposase
VVRLTPGWEDLENNTGYRKVNTIRRQVFDLEFKTLVTEYCVDVYENIDTGEIIKGEFPKDVAAPVQYGPELRNLVIYLRVEGVDSYGKIAALVLDRFGLQISEATIVNILQEANLSVVLDDCEAAAAIDTANSPRANSDETSINVNGKNQWVHILTSDLFVNFFLHAKRGMEAMKAWGMLENFTGVLVHDCFAPYFKYKNFKHALCNAHIIRELQAALEVGQGWAEDMIELLLDLNVYKIQYGGLLPPSLQAWAVQCYEKIISKGYDSTGGRVLARPPNQKGKRGRFAKPSYRNLLERLDLRQDAVLRFITAPCVPFTNNDAERPVRSLKVRIKVSGCFRSEAGARAFCRMKGYILSCKKNGISPPDAIRMMLNNETPDFIAEILS